MFLFLTKGKLGPKTQNYSHDFFGSLYSDEGNSVLISTACQTKYLFYINLGKCHLKNKRVFTSSIIATMISFFVTNIGFQDVRHYHKIEQCCYFEDLTNFIC